MLIPRHRKIAIIYDFDGTLAPGNMHEHSFFPFLKIKREDFWEEVKQTARAHDMDQVLTYMQLMIEKLKNENASIRREEFNRHGMKIPLFAGLQSEDQELDWFDRVNDYGRDEENRVEVEHYIISSGIYEIIQGTPIKKHFKRIFASKFKYNRKDEVEWPALAINYTTKTQYLFRINKGIENSWDDGQINQYTPMYDRPIPFGQMIYIGDGDTDIPCMKMIKYQGGYSIAVYDQDPEVAVTKKPRCERLLEHDRADYVAAANYSRRSPLETIVYKLIRKIATELDLDTYGKKHRGNRSRG